MSPEEVEQWITLPGEEENTAQQTARPKFNVGDEVEIVDGPIRGVRGNVKEIDTERGIIIVEIMVFARLTQMELEFWQVEKVVE
jgi:transcriptional antiterminator NusG